jgi:hypothetical protein
MRSKEKSPLFGRLGKTRRNSIWIRGRRELSHPFSENIPQRKLGFREPRKA